MLSYAHVVREDPERPGMLYLGTENTVYLSVDNGDNWLPLRNNLPPVPIHWLTIQEGFGDLVLGTYGRGFWILDDLSPLRQLSAEVLSADAHLFAPRPAYRLLRPGLFIAAVLAAAMSSIAAELNSLSTTSVIDFYRRWVKPEATDAHYLKVSKMATGFWGVFAGVVAMYAVSLGSLIEVVNRFGSFFYGSILGAFLLAMIPRAKGVGAFYGLIAGMTAVATVTFGFPSVSFLWHNVIGAVTVVVVGVVLSHMTEARAS